jgi:hypothetical protein
MRLILVIDSPSSPLGSLLWRELIAQGVQPDALVLCRKRAAFATRLLRRLKRVARQLAQKLCIRFGGCQQSFAGLWDSFAPTGMNSWDFLSAEAIDLAVAARDKAVEWREFSDIHDKECIDYLNSVSPAAVACLAGGILKPSLFAALPQVIFMNAHMAKVPPYRGMNAAEWATLAGDSMKVTIMAMNAGIDTGDVLATYDFLHHDYRSVRELREIGYRSCCLAMASQARQMKSGDWQRVPQAIGEGRQHYVLHPKLRTYLEQKLNLRGSGAQANVG